MKQSAKQLVRRQTRNIDLDGSATTQAADAEGPQAASPPEWCPSCATHHALPLVHSTGPASLLSTRWAWMDYPRRKQTLSWARVRRDIARVSNRWWPKTIAEAYDQNKWKPIDVNPSAAAAAASTCLEQTWRKLIRTEAAEPMWALACLPPHRED